MATDGTRGAKPTASATIVIATATLVVVLLFVGALVARAEQGIAKVCFVSEAEFEEECLLVSAGMAKHHKPNLEVLVGIFGASALLVATAATCLCPSFCRALLPSNRESHGSAPSFRASSRAGHLAGCICRLSACHN